MYFTGILHNFQNAYFIYTRHLRYEQMHAPNQRKQIRLDICGSELCYTCTTLHAKLDSLFTERTATSISEAALYL